jgi:predicted ATP-grasp superfamily ATP-dependent carboligase
MKQFIINYIPFSDWEPILYNNNKIIRCKDEDINKLQNCYILPISIQDYFKYNNHLCNIFRNNLENIDILNNKSKFGKYMMNNFINNIPTVYYYNFDNNVYESNDITMMKMIKKPNIGWGGEGIEIVYNINNNLKDTIISKYIEHTEYFVGHFIILNGIILDKIYFSSNYKYDDNIKRGPIENYEIMIQLEVDDSIFYKIFSNLSYSGFADTDFTIIDNKIIIFEINPRPGGSLIRNNIYFNKFLDRLIKFIP